jgi:nitrile hydratase
VNGVHDMGGMEGLGAIDPAPGEPLFHAPWEARALALTLAAGALGRWNIDESRRYRESIPGPVYLAVGYYERWIMALIGLLIDKGLISESELATGAADPAALRSTPPLRARQVAEVLARGGPCDRPEAEPPRFAVGEKVRAKDINPSGHTRLPRYARGRAGVVTRRHGVFVFPDTNAHGLGEQPRPLYQVRFEAEDLWGSAARGPGAVHLDLWESYLDPA